VIVQERRRRSIAGGLNVPALVLSVYVLLCFLSGYFGRDSRLGFWACTAMAAVFTPLVVLPVLFLLGGGRRPGRAA